MTYSESIPIPIVPPEDTPYMQDLYRRCGLETTATADTVLDAARAKWEAAHNVGARVETAELLRGQRIGGFTIGTLPEDLKGFIFNGGDFESFIGTALPLADLEQSFKEA